MHSTCIQEEGARFQRCRNELYGMHGVAVDAYVVTGARRPRVHYAPNGETAVQERPSAYRISYEKMRNK